MEGCHSQKSRFIPYNIIGYLVYLRDFAHNITHPGVEPSSTGKAVPARVAKVPLANHVCRVSDDITSKEVKSSFLS